MSNVDTILFVYQDTVKYQDKMRTLFKKSGKLGQIGGLKLTTVVHKSLTIKNNLCTLKAVKQIELTKYL